MKRILYTLGIALLPMIFTLPLSADDIDIYQAGIGAGPRRVMLVLDLRQGFHPTICEDAAAATCIAKLGERVHSSLDLYGLLRDGAGELQLVPGADGAADSTQDDPAGSALSIARAHWPGTAVQHYDLLRATLRAVLTELGSATRGAPGAGRVEVGLMAVHANDCSGAGPQYVPVYSATPVVACSRGAYVLQGFADISVPANLEHLLLKLAALPDPDRQAPWMNAAWPGHPYVLRDIYFELFRYLSGQAVFNGFLGASDFGSRSSGNLYHNASGPVTNDVLLASPEGVGGQALLAPDSTILVPDSFDLAADRVANALYRSPIGPGQECSRVAVVNFLSGPTSSAHPDTNAAISAPVTLGGLGISLPAGTGGDAKMLSALAAADPGAVKAALADTPPVDSYFFVPQADEASSSLAAAGGTGRPYTSTDPGELLLALNAVFQPAVGASSSLVAASVPSSAHVSAHIAAQSPGDIYFALFQPGPGPRWHGNIKKLKLLPGGLIAQAPLNSPTQPAMSAEDGWILRDALTFWTDPLGADVLAFDPALGEVPGRDGRSVTRGGAGQQVPGFLQGLVASSNSEPGARQLFTLDPAIPGELMGLDATQAALEKLADVVDPGALMSSDEQLALLHWVRGADSFDADGDSDRHEPRRWLLANPLHSRPLAIDYGARPGTAYSSANPDIRLFFGTNDGLFHILRNTNEGGVDRESGRETWAFIPHSLLARQALLAQGGGGAAAGHAYGMDGEAVAHIFDRDRDGNIESDEGDRVWVFVGQRRGGKELYAFDMTNPDQPRFKWVISNNTPGFDQLALTFSTPRVARLDMGGSAPVTVLVFAGGYNGGWNGGARVGKDAGAGPDLVGNAIFVVDADSGSLLWRAVGPNGGSAPAPSDQLQYVADLIHSIPSPVTVVDTDHNGVDDSAYVGDSGGNVWRIEFTEDRSREPGAAAAVQSNWHLARIAALGGSGASDRRFFHAPDVVHSRDAEGDYTGVLILSGNRAAPRETLTRDFAYLLKDRRMAPAVSHAALADITGVCSTAEADECSAANLEQGWKLALQDPGEKGLSTPLVSNGVVYFTSYLPSAGGEASTCVSDQGASRVYAVNLANGSPGLPRARKLRLEEDEAPETEPATEPATDDEVVPRYQDIGPGLRGDLLPYGNSILVPGQGLDGAQLYGLPGRSRWRAYWREEQVDPL